MNTKSLLRRCPAWITKRLYLALLALENEKEKQIVGPILLEKHLENCQLLPSRKHLLDNFPKGGTVAEIGVEKGMFAKEIWKHSAPEILVLIDLWEGDKGMNNMQITEKIFSDEIKNDKIILKKGNSLIELENFSNNYFDWIYIDSSHLFDHTLKELKLASIKIKEGGILAGHDFTQGNWKARFKYGVIDAVYQFCKIYNWELIYLTMEPDCYRSFALKKL